MEEGQQTRSRVRHFGIAVLLLSFGLSALQWFQSRAIWQEYGNAWKRDAIRQFGDVPTVWIVGSKHAYAYHRQGHYSYATPTKLNPLRPRLWHPCEVCNPPVVKSNATRPEGRPMTAAGFLGKGLLYCLGFGITGLIGIGIFDHQLNRWRSSSKEEKHEKKREFFTGVAALAGIPLMIFFLWSSGKPNTRPELPTPPKERLPQYPISSDLRIPEFTPEKYYKEEPSNTKVPGGETFEEFLERQKRK